MATLISGSTGDGHTRRCTATCYNAKHEHCQCICGGINHGKGLDRAVENTAQAAEAIREKGGQVPRLPIQTKFTGAVVAAAGYTA